MSDIINETLNLLKSADYPISSEDIEMILKSEKNAVTNALKTLLKNNEIVKIGSRQNTEYGVMGIDFDNNSTRYTGEFKSIKNANELKDYLDNAADRLQKTSLLCQYTNLGSVIGIIKNQFWYLGSPKKMNDGLELQQGLNQRDNIFFASFMADQKESIAMWSMYSQPWEDGVMISIPKAEFKKWVKDTKKVYSADVNTKLPDKNNFVYLNKARVYISRVAYSNQSENGEVESLSCGSAKNNLLKSLADQSLIGYIKDDAWSYEKEVRLRVDLGKEVSYQGVAIEVPDYIINSMIITKGPRFKGEILERIKEKCEQAMTTRSSLFYNKLKYTPCDSCSYKNR